MAELMNLSSELLLCVASFLPQIDLLNVSLTCTHLRNVTEPELYREYVNPCIYRRSFTPFLRTLLERPELTRYVHRLELKYWSTLDHWNPEYCEGRIEEFQEHLQATPQPSEIEYDTITQAAKSVGIISSIFPFEQSSSIVRKIWNQVLNGLSSDRVWYEYIYDADIRIEDVPYDQKFCQLLRSGVEDPYVVLMLALLPNIREIFLHAAPADWNTLPWRVPHNFDALRHFSARSVEGDSDWPLAFFSNLLGAGKLEILETFGTSSWWQHREKQGRPSAPVQFSLRPGVLSLQHLVLQWSTLALTEMKQLVDACRHLRSFYFSSGDEWITVKPSPKKIVELMRAHKDTLEELYLDIAYYGGAVSSKEGIRSLADFKCLKVLDTLPHNWVNLIESDIQQGPIEGCDRLCNRLPPNVEKVIFHQGETTADISTYQVRDLFGMDENMLPKLQDLTIETMTTDHKRLMADVWQAARKAGPVLFNFHPVIAEAREIGTETIFDVTSHPRESLCTKWTGEKYAEQKPVKHPIVEAFDRHARDFPEDRDFSGLDVRALALDGLIREPTIDSEDEYGVEIKEDTDSEEADEYGVAIWEDTDSSEEADE
jgi:hypothetical protein